MSDLPARAAVLLAVLALAGGLGLLLRRRAGRVRTVDGASRLGAERLSAGDLGSALGERATLVQFSSPACSSCRSVRRVLTGMAGEEPGVTHIEVDGTQRLDLVRRLGILRTPTVVVLDPGGAVVRRASGALTPVQAQALLAEEIR